MSLPLASPLEALLAQDDPTVHLDLAALEIARVESPKLDLAPFLDLLDSHARELRQLTSINIASTDNIGEARVHVPAHVLDPLQQQLMSFFTQRLGAAQLQAKGGIRVP